MLTKREADAAQKRQERLKLRAKMHNKELTREGLSLDSGGGGRCSDAKSAEKPRSCWWEKVCDKLNRASNDGESDHEEARVSRNLFDLFEQTDRTEIAVTTAARRMVQGTERAEQGHFGEEQRRTNPTPERDELEQATQSSITYLDNLPMHKPSLPILTEAANQRFVCWCLC